MKAMILERIANLTREEEPLRLADLPEPRPGAGETLIRVSACGVCHTELDEIEGRTPPPRLPVVPGHQVVGRVVGNGPGAGRFPVGARVGVAWIHSACGACPHCLGGNENLCPGFRATGRDADGGYAEYMAVPEAFAQPVPEVFSDAQAAPLLCAGAVGYRSLRLTGLRDGQVLGLTGFLMAGLFIILHIQLNQIWLAMLAMGVATFFHDVTTPGAWGACMDVGGKYAGTLSGSMNMMGNFGSLASPIAMGYILKYTGNNWTWCLYSVVAAYLLMEVAELRTPEPVPQERGQLRAGLAPGAVMVGQKVQRRLKPQRLGLARDREGQGRGGFVEELVPGRGEMPHHLAPVGQVMDPGRGVALCVRLLLAREDDCVLGLFDKK